MLLYFLNGKRSVDQSLVEAAGLSYAFDQSPRYRESGHGPGETDGVTFAQTDSGALCVYQPEKQQWFPYPGQPDLFFGWWNDSRPTPAQLQKRDLTSGHDIELNGQVWHVPKARYVPDSLDTDLPLVFPSLPRKAKTDGVRITGVGDVLEQYRRLWEISEIVYESYSNIDPQSDRITLPADATELAAELIAHNYRVALPEICELELVRANDPNLTWRILRLSIDAPTIDAWYKKKESLMQTESNDTNFLPAESPGKSTSPGNGA